MITIVTFIPALNELTLIITHNIQPLRVAVIVILGTHVENWIHDVVGGCVCRDWFVPVASNLDPTQPQIEKPTTFLNILNNDGLLRTHRFLYKIGNAHTRERVSPACHPTWICHISSHLPLSNPAYLSIQQ